jgi:hypothetical protein
MPTMTMTVRYVNPPKPGKQRGSIKGTDDQILGVFAAWQQRPQSGGR